jgi:putative glutamine amidotransferase
MKKENTTLEYLPSYNAFGISDEAIKDYTEKKIIPIISLKDEDYEKLGCTPPDNDAPVVAFLMGREKGHYTIDFNYAKAIAQSNVKIRFLTYNNNINQMDDVDGLILPGGAFDSPDEFYTDPLKKTENKPGMRSYAYVTSIMTAKDKKMPILGICAGAQIIGGMHGLKMFRNIKEYTDTKIEHKTKDLNAHKITINPNSPLYNIIKEKQITVNSRHNESIANGCGKGLDIYAVSEDGIPGAWGNEDENILCVQWHPEDFACNGNNAMQGIYNWISSKAQIYKKQKELKKSTNEKNWADVLKNIMFRKKQYFDGK